MTSTARDQFFLSLKDDQLGKFLGLEFDPDCDDKMKDILTRAQYDLYEAAKQEKAGQNGPHGNTTKREEFLASLSDNQQGAFFEFEGHPDCDEKMKDVLKMKQYEMYEAIKEEKVNDLQAGDTDTVVSWEDSGSVVSVTPSQAVSGAGTVTTTGSQKSLSIFITIFTKVVEHLNRAGYALRKNIESSCNVKMNAMENNKNKMHTTVRLVGLSKESLIEAQNLVWADLKALQKKQILLSNKKINDMWKDNWVDIDRVQFKNRTNVQPLFTTDCETILLGFDDGHLKDAAKLLEEYSKNGKLPSEDKNIVVNDKSKNAKKPTQAANSPANSVVTVPRQKYVPPPPQQPKSFRMFIHAAVLQQLEANGCLRKKVEEEYGAAMECSLKDENTTLVVLRGINLIDVQYTIWEYLSRHQGVTNDISDISLATMWDSWTKFDKVVFFLETTVFVTEYGTLQLRAFNHLQMAEAWRKLQEYQREGKKPSGPKKMNGGMSKSVTNLSTSMTNLSMVSNVSSGPPRQNKPRLENGPQIVRKNLRIEVEEADLSFVSGGLIGTKGANVKAIKEMFHTYVQVNQNLGSVIIELSAPTQQNIDETINHIWSRLRSKQKYEESYSIATSHRWISWSKKEKLEFQTNFQVTIVCENGVGLSKLILKSFIADKIQHAWAHLSQI